MSKKRRKKNKDRKKINHILVDLTKFNDDNSITLHAGSHAIEIKNLLKNEKSIESTIAKKHRIDWKEEVIKSIITSVIVVLLSTMIIWVAYNNSPGEYRGEKLEDYFAKQIERGIGTQGVIIDTVFYSSDDTILVCAKHVSSVLGGDNITSVCIFERKERDFWNVLFGTEAGYRLSLHLYYKDCNSDGGLVFAGCKNDEIDGGIGDEIAIQYTCNYANHISEVIILLHKQDDNWAPLTPDFSTLYDELGDRGKKIHLLYDEYKFIDVMNNNTEYIFYGLSYGGYVTKEDNPLFGGYDFLYFIVANNGSGGMLDSNSLVLVMERVNGDIYRDPNWNLGKPLYFDKCDDLDFYEIIPEHWGMQINGITFYGPDEEIGDT